MSWDSAGRHDEPHREFDSAILRGLAGELPNGEQVGPGLIAGITGRPRLPIDEKRRSIGVSLPPGIIAKLDLIASNSHRNRSEVIEYIVGEWDKESWNMGIATRIPDDATPQATALHASAAITGWVNPSAGASATIGVSRRPAATTESVSLEELQVVEKIITSAIVTWIQTANPTRAEITEAIIDFRRAAFGDPREP